MQDYDDIFPNAGWMVGFESDAPNILKQRLAAALVATQLGVASVDNIFKQYTRAVSYERPERLGRTVSDFVASTWTFLHELAGELTYLEHADERIGRTLAEWGFLRLQFSTQLLLMLINRGALFESLAVLRAQLEQIAWVVAVDRLADAEVAKVTRGQASIGVLLRTSTPARVATTAT